MFPAQLPSSAHFPGALALRSEGRRAAAPLAGREVCPAAGPRLAAARGGGAAGPRPEEGPGRTVVPAAAPLPEVGTALPGAPGISERCPPRSRRGAARSHRFSPCPPPPLCLSLPLSRGFSPPARRSCRREVARCAAWHRPSPSDARGGVTRSQHGPGGTGAVAAPRSLGALGGRGGFPALQAWNAEVSFTFTMG